VTGAESRRTRRELALGAPLVVAAGGVLAACGGSSSTGGAPAAGASPAKGPVTIEVLTRAGVANPTGHSQYYAHITPERFTPENNITVNFIDAQPDVNEKLTVLAAGNTLPDVSWFGIVADGSGGPEAATKGIFKPLDDFVKKDAKFDKAPYFKALLDAFSVGGKLFALPVHGHYGTNVLYYNANLIKAAGINVPADGSWTVDDMIAAAQKVVRKGDDVWGFFPATDLSESGVFYIREFGGEFLDEAGKKCLLDSSESRTGLEWVRNAQAKFQTIDNLYRDGGFTRIFEAGQLGFFNATPAQVALYKKPGQQVIKFELGVALFPRGPGGRRGTQASGSGMGLVGTAKQDASWEWIKFITSKDVGVIGVTTGGAGSPGGRTDVWNDPRFLAFDPVYAAIIKAYPQGAGSVRLPANYRRTELLKVAGDELAEFYRGNVSVTEATSKAVQQANAVLSQ
jgi:multiple sugar transport system substrate-binding protein